MTENLPQKIVFLAFEMPPAHGGGLSTYMAHACMALAENGIDVTVIVPNADVKEERRVFSAFGARVVAFNPYTHFAFRYLGHWPAMSYAFSDQLKWVIETDGRPDLVEVCDGFALGYYAMLRRLTLEEPFDGLHFVVTGHTPTALIDRWEGHDPYQLPRYWTGVMERWCFHAADRVHVPSDFLIGALHEDFDLGGLEMERVPNPYHPEAQGLLAAPAHASAQMRAISELPEGDFACVISRITHWKGIPAIIAAFERLWEEGEEIQLRIYGADTQDASTGGSMVQMLSQRHRQHVDEGRLVFAGLAAPGIVAEIRARAAFQVHPSVSENFPYTVVEALAAETIVIANSHGGQAELIQDGQSGILYEPEDPASFSRAYRRFRKMTDRQRQQMRAAAKARVAEYCDPEKYAERKRATIDALRDQPPRRRFPFVYGTQKIAPAQEPAASGAEKDLTVVIPYYNMQDFIHETVRSVHESTIPVDIILVNDGSTHPDTDRTLETLSREYPELTVISKPNSGVADTRNTGVEAATTRYVALLDADDVVEPDYYRRAIEILDRYENVAFVGCWADDFDENGTIRYWPTFSPEPPLQYIMNTVNAQALIYRRSAFLAAGRHDPALNMFLDDWESTISLVDNGYRGVMIPHPLFRYRIRPDSIFRSGTPRWVGNYGMITEKYAHTFSRYATEITRFLNANGPNHLYHNPTHSTNVGLVSEHQHTPPPFAEGRLMRLAAAYYRYMYGDRPRPVAHALRRVVTVPANMLVSISRSMARRGKPL